MGINFFKNLEIFHCVFIKLLFPIGFRIITCIYYVRGKLSVTIITEIMVFEIRSKILRRLFVSILIMAFKVIIQRLRSITEIGTIC